MTGWTSKELPAQGLLYKGVIVGAAGGGSGGSEDDVDGGDGDGGGDSGGASERQREEKRDGTLFRCFGETGAQSSLIPSLDACLGIATDAGAAGDALVPYLRQMRGYMPSQHANFVTKLEAGSQVRACAAASTSPRLVKGYNEAVQALHRFRGLHMSLAYVVTSKKSPPYALQSARALSLARSLARVRTVLLAYCYLVPLVLLDARHS